MQLALASKQLVRVSITNIRGSLVALVVIVVIDNVTDAHCSSSMPGMRITILILVNETGSGCSLGVEMAEHYYVVLRRLASTSRLQMPLRVLTLNNDRMLCNI